MKRAKKWIGLGIVVVLLLGCAISNVVLSSSNEAKLIEQYQSCVYVGNECINTYRNGVGEKTIVIIPDVDVLAPFVEYRPLIDQLSIHYNVLLIEPFGKGLSDISDNERSVTQIVSELHSAVTLSGVDEPYILMTFGYSNVYALSYLYAFEDEVELYVTIDPNVPNQIDYMEYQPVSKLAGIVQKMGLARLSKYIMPEVLISSRYSEAYSKTQLNTMMEVSAIKYGNANIVEETQGINALLQESKGLKLPTSIPTLAFVSQYDVEQHVWWLTEMQAFFPESDICRLNVVRTYQFMHRTNYHDIEVHLGRFIEDLNSEE